VREERVSLGGEKQRHIFLARVCGGERCVPSVVLFQNEKNSKNFQPKTQTDTRTHAHTHREGRRKKTKQRKETRGYDSVR